MITLFGGPTTNVRKIAIGLEELGLNYECSSVALDRKEQTENWFSKMSPNQKIPVLADDATDQTIWESGAILIYLADHYDDSGLILARSGAPRYRALQGAFFQAAHIGANLGRLNEQMTAPDDKKNPAMMGLFYNEAVRLTEVLDRMLSDERPFLAGDYSIADIMHYPWLKAGLDIGFPAMLEKPRIVGWLTRIGARPAVTRGMKAFGG